MSAWPQRSCRNSASFVKVICHAIHSCDLVTSQLHYLARQRAGIS